MADYTTSSLVYRLICLTMITQYQFNVVAFTLPRHQSSLNSTMTTAIGDPMLPIEEPPAQTDADDEAVGDDAIDRLFEAYERQFLHDKDDTNGAKGAHFGRHVRRTNLEGVEAAEEVGSGFAPAKPIVGEAASDGDDVPDTAEASALEHIATIVSDEHVLTELRKEIPAEDYVPLDVTVGEQSAGLDMDVGAAVYDPLSRSHEGVIDVSTQYDVSNAHANSRTGRQLLNAKLPDNHNNSTADTASGLRVDIEIIADIPADESFVSDPTTDKILSRDELLQEESLLPRELSAIHKTTVQNEVHELQATIENNQEASDVVLAPIVDATLLDDAHNDLVSIAALKTTPRERRVAIASSSSLSVEGSGDDSDEQQVKSKATIIDDAVDLNESDENDSNTAAERRQGKAPKSLGNESDDDSSDESSSVSKVLHSVVEAVELSTEVNRNIQSFRDAVAESTAIRQTRSRAAGRVAAASPVGDRLLMADSDGLGDEDETHQATRSAFMVSAVVGYGCILGVLCGTMLMVGICLVLDRVRRVGQEYMIPGEIEQCL